MGLVEKRAIQEIIQKEPVWKQRLSNAASGIPLELEVKWETLATEGDSQLYGEWEKIFISPLESVLKSICTDQIGKDAFEKKINKIRIQNIAQVASGELGITFEGKMIVLDHMLANVDDHDDRVRYWIKALEGIL